MPNLRTAFIYITFNLAILQNGSPMRLIRRSAPMLKSGRMEARKISSIPGRPEQK
ncbi:hypothetical protein [Paenibacillus amylolyticus]|uniref:Uncharacterized protein n=1 Tax=Paenibacillus amylolyticus TaxID=1451 RepID=A0A100VNI4_PAEAM|nr:hypothetical protein [Paenibacillus amylolyticus]GAS82979.1 unknown protein [Paenibacillus amylolyticus]